MKEYLAFPVVLLASTWSILKLELDAVQTLNAIRNFCLGITKDSADVSKALRWNVFVSDWIALWLAVLLSMILFVAIFCMIPRLFRELLRVKPRAAETGWAKVLLQNGLVSSHINDASYGMALIGVVVFLAHLAFGVFDWCWVAETLR